MLSALSLCVKHLDPPPVCNQKAKPYYYGINQSCCDPFITEPIMTMLKETSIIHSVGPLLLLRSRHVGDPSPQLFLGYVPTMQETHCRMISSGDSSYHHYHQGSCDYSQVTPKFGCCCPCLEGAGGGSLNSHQHHGYPPLHASASSETLPLRHVGSGGARIYSIWKLG